MKKFIFLIVASLLFTNLTYGQEIVTTSIKIDCVNLNTNLKKGMKSNSDIVVLQDFLKSKNYLNANSTGFFGVQTLKAVKDFQKDNNINPTGFVGPITRSFINKLTCVIPAVNTSTTPIIENTNPIAPVVSTPTEITPTPPIIEDVILTAPNNSSLRVRTDSVLSITNNSISVRGTVTAGARSGTEAWFELTTNSDLYKTSETKISNKISQKSNEKFESSFSNLLSQTNYYFRACAGNTSLGQRSCGSTIFVKTN